MVVVLLLLLLLLLFSAHPTPYSFRLRQLLCCCGILHEAYGGAVKRRRAAVAVCTEHLHCLFHSNEEMCSIPPTVYPFLRSFLPLTHFHDLRFFIPLSLPLSAHLVPPPPSSFSPSSPDPLGSDVLLFFTAEKAERSAWTSDVRRLLLGPQSASLGGQVDGQQVRGRGRGGRGDARRA